jgi:hypothetical protein
MILRLSSGHKHNEHVTPLAVSCKLLRNNTHPYTVAFEINQRLQDDTLTGNFRCLTRSWRMCNDSGSAAVRFSDLVSSTSLVDNIRKIGLVVPWPASSGCSSSDILAEYEREDKWCSLEREGT